MVTRFQLSWKFIFVCLKYCIIYPCISLKERRRGHGIGEASLEQTEHRLDQEPEAGGHSWKKGKGRWRLYVLYIDLCLCIVDIYAAEPWYLDILLYPVTLNSYWLLLQHVRANKASLQTLSVSSLTCTPPPTRSTSTQTYRTWPFDVLIFDVPTPWQNR